MIPIRLIRSAYHDSLAKSGSSKLNIEMRCAFLDYPAVVLAHIVVNTINLLHLPSLERSQEISSHTGEIMLIMCIILGRAMQRAK